ncbi:MAG: TonB-dependent receptor plug domain-containing protein [Prevotella sp.]|jgi:TonB-dependent SusC/RagA subfamily outer membrane receptor|nr:TonB-dependent receptor plug domain-containing protein [Prevotella sp.]
MKRLSNKLIVLFAILAVSISTKAQIAEDPITDSITNNFLRQAISFPQEKIYVQIDKPFYITGEDIWFRAHLADALSNVPDTTSRYIYAELINPIDSIIKRVKIRPTKGAYCGHITLEEDMPEGQYLLRFYTRFMEGLGDGYYFKRTVYIGDPLTALYRTNAKFEYEDTQKVKIELQIVDIKNNTPIKPDKIQITDDKGNLKTVKTDEDDIIRLTQKVAESQNKNSLYIEYDYDGKFHKQFITIPNRSDYEVSFLPEGGHLVAGVINKIAYKSLNSNGFGEDIKGTIVNQNGDSLRSFQSQHLGMGSIILQPPVGEVFSIICENNAGLIKKYDLPIATTEHISLQAVWQRNRLTLSVLTPSENPLGDRELYLAIQSRGTVLNAIKWNNSQQFVTIPKDELPTGIIQLLLIDSDMNPISERLVFNINEANIANISFSTDKENYGRRELVEGNIKLSDIDENPLTANLSISVTDDKDIQPDTCVNILSTLLLTSELKGHVENPAYYFKNKTNETNTYLDLIMLTHGWSRYNVTNILKGNFDRPKSYLELGPEISGIVKGGLLMTKPAANYPVTLISMETGLFDQTQTDENGRFHFQGFETPDSTRFIIQGTTKKGSSRVELLIDQETFPTGKFSLPLTPQENRNNFANYFEKADKNFTLANGMRMIYLKDVEITARAPRSVGKSAYSSSFNQRKTIEDIDRLRPHSIFDILREFGGVMIMGNTISIRGGGSPLVLVDDIEYDVDFLENLVVEDVDEVEVVKDGGAAFWGGRGANGVIMITTKRGVINTKSGPVFNIKTYTPLGYQTTKEFYSPQYTTRAARESNTPDMRTTIYWNPSIKTSEDGDADVNFYTSDASSTYSVIIEGITSDGRLIHAIEKISRED